MCQIGRGGRWQSVADGQFSARKLGHQQGQLQGSQVLPDNRAATESGRLLLEDHQDDHLHDQDAFHQLGDGDQ